MVGITRPSAADLLTLGNALCGGAVILLVATNHSSADALRIITVLVVCGSILDGLDGPVARRFGGSPLGASLDNLADCVTFGVAPAVVLSVLVDAHGPARALVLGGALVYVAGALLRLADFAAVRHDEPGFVGLPSPLAATGAILFGFLAPAPWAAGLALAVLGLLMVSRVRYPPQSGAALVLSVSGWLVWMGGAFGLYPMPGPAIFGLVTMLVVVPVTYGMRLRVRVPASVSVEP